MNLAVTQEGWAEIKVRLEGKLKSDGFSAVLPDGILDSSEVNGLLQKISLNAGVRLLVFSRLDRVVIVALAACLLNKACLIVGNSSAPIEGIVLQCEQCDADVLIIDNEILDKMPSDVSRYDRMVCTAKFMSSGLTLSAVGSDTSTSIMVFTSGTTQQSKLVELSPTALVAQLNIFERVYGFDERTRHVNLLPLHHVDGLIRGALAALWFGCVLLRREIFSMAGLPVILEGMTRDRATHFSVVPSILRMLERFSESHAHAFVTDVFSMIICSGDFLEPSLWARIETCFKTIVVNSYGLSEAVCDALFAGPDDLSRMYGTIGNPCGVQATILSDKGGEVEIGEIGELALSGATVMNGYFRSSVIEKTALGTGAFRTGDLARQLHNGLFELVGRKKSAVIVGGVTVFPEGISEAILSHPEVLEAHTWGEGAFGEEELVAAVVLRTVDRVDAGFLMDHLRTKLAPRLLPNRINILTELPRSPTGKILIDVLVDLVGRPDLHSSFGSDIETEVIAVAAICFKQSKSRLSGYSTPFNTDGWDSLNHVKFILEIERRFNILFSPSEIAAAMSLFDFIEVVKGRRVQKWEPVMPSGSQ